MKTSALTAIYLIARREFITRVRSRVFVIGTALIIVGIVGYVGLQVLLLQRQGTTTPTFTVAFLGETQQLADPFIAGAKTLGAKVERKDVADQSQAESQINKRKLDLLVTGSANAPEVVVRDQMSPSLRAVLQGVVRQRALDSTLSSAGIDPAAVNAKIAGAVVQVRSLKPASGERAELVAAGFIAAVLLYIALLTYGNFIAQGVVEEKANRIVEILLSTVRPEQLLTGKVIGIGLVGLFQLTLIGVVGVALATAAHIFAVPAAAVGVLFTGLLWFILGFFLYAVMFAAAGSLVSRNEEVQSAAMPITMLAILAYFVAIGVLTPMFNGDPMSTTGVILAMIPPISPVLMPTGMATGDIAPWQAALAVVLTLLTSAAAAWVAARIYANSVLRIGARVKLGEALRAVRAGANA